MKSSGFNIVDIHLRDIDRITPLTAMVCMAWGWAYLVGKHKDIKPIIFGVLELISQIYPQNMNNTFCFC